MVYIAFRNSIHAAAHQCHLTGCACLLSVQHGSGYCCCPVEIRLVSAAKLHDDERLAKLKRNAHNCIVIQMSHWRQGADLLLRINKQKTLHTEALLTAIKMYIPPRAKHNQAWV